MNANDILMEEKTENKEKEPEFSKKTKTVILHNRELSEDEQHILGLIFPHVVCFAFSFHCAKDIDDLVADGNCLILNISKNKPKHINWYQEQCTNNFNIVVVATKLKKTDRLYLMGALGMVKNIEKIMVSAERLYQKCTPLEFCSNLFCFC